MIESAVHYLLAILAISQTGLLAVFLVAFISATLLPMGSEPLVFAMVKAHPDLFWLIVAIATVGNTLGGVVNYAMGYGAKNVFAKEKHYRWLGWLRAYGAKTLLLAWLPIIGDPLCALGGWLKLPFWPCVAYMAIGKLLRYVLMTALLLSVPEHWWTWIMQLA